MFFAIHFGILSFLGLVFSQQLTEYFFQQCFDFDLILTILSHITDWEDKPCQSCLSLLLFVTKS